MDELMNIFWEKLGKKVEEYHNSSEYESLTLHEQIDTDTLFYLVEVMDLKNVYLYELKGNFYATFKDDNGVIHSIRIVYQPLTNPKHEVKLWFVDKDGKVSYGRPNLHYNLGPDDKIFNTYIKILTEEFLENKKFFESVKSMDKSGLLYLPATDRPRYRLYRMALNKFLDKSKYKIYDDPNQNNTIIIKNENTERT